MLPELLREAGAKCGDHRQPIGLGDGRKIADDRIGNGGVKSSAAAKQRQASGSKVKDGSLAVAGDDLEVSVTPYRKTRKFRIAYADGSGSN